MLFGRWSMVSLVGAQCWAVLLWQALCGRRTHSPHRTGSWMSEFGSPAVAGSVLMAW